MQKAWVWLSVLQKPDYRRYTSIIQVFGRWMQVDQIFKIIYSLQRESKASLGYMEFCLKKSAYNDTESIISSRKSNMIGSENTLENIKEWRSWRKEDSNSEKEKKQELGIRSQMWHKCFVVVAITLCFHKWWIFKVKNSCWLWKGREHNRLICFSKKVGESGKRKEVYRNSQGVVLLKQPVDSKLPPWELKSRKLDVCKVDVSGDWGDCEEWCRMPYWAKKKSNREDITTRTLRTSIFEETTQPQSQSCYFFLSVFHLFF